MVVRVLGQGAVMADPATAASTVSPLPEPALWFKWGSVFAGAGYRDNVLLSHGGEEGSSFLRGGVDGGASWSRGRMSAYAALRATGTRYFTTRDFDHEEQAILLSEWSYRIGQLKLTLGGNASYSHLIYDVSQIESRQTVAEVKRTAGGLGPTVRWTFARSWWVEAQAAGRRDVYPDGYNNRGVHDGSLRFAWAPGRRFEASLAATEARRHYDVREEYSGVGLPIGGTLLKIVEREAELRLKATLDQAAHWQTDTRASAAHFVDNGAGYLEYHERKVRQEVDWTSGDWRVECEAGARRLEYARQTVGLGVAPPARVRDAFFGRLLVERALTPRWTVYAEYNWERNRCNDPIESYSMNEGLLGVRWNWEK
ncbi:MAG: hypothetical protein NTV51_18275 [Verrucomicrobia bacterium]|nr:hypothetical protein [Verrucomicrobiota bacterium]